MNKNTEEYIDKAKSKKTLEYKIICIVIAVLMIYMVLILSGPIIEMAKQGDVMFVIALIITGIIVGVMLFCFIKTVFEKMGNKLSIYDELKELPLKKCVVEDVILFACYKRSSRTHGYNDYRLSLLVKDIETEKLYITFREDDFSKFAWQRSNLRYNSPTRIMKKDKTFLEIGDYVWMACKEPVKKEIRIINEKKLSINNLSTLFSNRNEKYDINILKQAQFFVGIIDIDGPQTQYN